MKGDLGLIEDIKKLIIARYPRFASQIAKTEFKYNSNLLYHTAGTDGKTIYIDPDYFAGLDLDNRIFLVAHELMHIKFEHKSRLKNRDGNMRDSHVWNIATDAIINANLERDGFVIPKGSINIKDALKYNSEELYDLLCQEKQRQQGNASGGQSQEGQPQQEQEGSSQGGQENKSSNEKDKNGDKNKQGQSEGSGENSQEEKQGKEQGKQGKDKPKDSQGNSSENGKDEEQNKGNSQGKGDKNSQNEQNASAGEQGNSDNNKNQDKTNDSQNSSQSNQDHSSDNQKDSSKEASKDSSGKQERADNGQNENKQDSGQNENKQDSGQNAGQGGQNSPVSQDSIVKDFDFSQDTIDDHSLWEDNFNKNQERKQNKKSSKKDKQSNKNSSNQEENNQNNKNSSEQDKKESKNSSKQDKQNDKNSQNSEQDSQNDENSSEQDGENDDENLKDEQNKQNDENSLKQEQDDQNDEDEEENSPIIHEHDRPDPRKQRFEQIGEQDNSQAKNEFWKFDKDKFVQDSPDYEAKLDEKEEFNKNRQERREITKQKFQQRHEQVKHTTPFKMSSFEDIGKTKPILDWKLLLRREVEKTETIWSQRRSIAENNYAYRLEENDLDEGAETEVLIDASSSVSDNMIISFVRQLKNIVKNSTLKVKFFAGVVTKDFIEIKTERDVDKMTIFRPYDGTNYDAAVRAFSNKRETNKIIFTDGTYGSMPKRDLANANVIWLVYKNSNFKPCCGKVINVYPESFNSGNKTNLIRDDEIERE